MQLQGTEVKSLRAGKASIAEAYCGFEGEELFILNMNIQEYERGGFTNHLPTRKRKLLLHKRELEKLSKKLKNQGLTIVPLRVFLADSGFIKIDIALAKGKKTHDKREDLKKKDAQRAMQRAEN